ncbi:MAG: HEAT repeat domain-containing protein [Capsulimonadaceae bacterium]
MNALLEEERVAETAALRERLLLDDEDARYGAAREALRDCSNIADTALRWIGDPSPRMREMASFILGRSGHLNDEPECSNECHRAVPALVRVLHYDSSGRARALAAFALAHHAQTSTIPDLIEAATDRVAEVREAAAYALGCFHGSNWESVGASYKAAVAAALMDLVDDPADDVRDWAVFGLRFGGHDTPETRLRLWRALYDRCPDVRGEAAEALAMFGDRSIAPRLEELLRDDEEPQLSYFVAAHVLGDPSLLAALRVGAQHWRAAAGPIPDWPMAITGAIDALDVMAHDES